MSEETEKKAKKISRMNITELDEKIKDAREKMGSDSAAYIQHLLRRRATLAK